MLSEKLREERGQDLVEYALVLAFIALGATAAMTTLSTTIGNALSTAGVLLVNLGTPAPRSTTTAETSTTVTPTAVTSTTQVTGPAR